MLEPVRFLVDEVVGQFKPSESSGGAGEQSEQAGGGGKSSPGMSTRRQAAGAEGKPADPDDGPLGVGEDGLFPGVDELAAGIDEDGVLSSDDEEEVGAGPGADSAGWLLVTRSSVRVQAGRLLLLERRVSVLDFFEAQDQAGIRAGDSGLDRSPDTSSSEPTAVPRQGRGGADRARHVPGDAGKWGGASISRSLRLRPLSTGASA